MKKEYTINTECDWCDEEKLCRYLHVGDGNVEIPVLAICRDCDSDFCDFCQQDKPVGSTVEVIDTKHPEGHLYTLDCCESCRPQLDPNWENLNNNQSKEDTMKNHIDLTNVPNMLEHGSTGKCMCVTAAGTMCKKQHHYTAVVEYRTHTAYLRGSAPLATQGTGWMWAQIPVCPTHKVQLEEGKAVKIPVLTDKDNVNFHDNKLQKFKEDNMQDETMQQEEKPTAREIVIDAFSQGTKAWVKHMLGECDPVTCIGTHDDEWFQRHNIDRNDLPEAFDDKQYDLEHTQKEQMKVFEGQPFRTEKFRGGGKVMIERCDHEDCNADHEAALMEVNAIGEVCCGDPNCNHWSAWPCLHHVAKKTLEVPGATPGRSQYVHETKTKGRFREWHATNGYASKMIQRLREEGFGGLAKFRVGQGRGFWVYWNVDHSLDEQFTPEERTITGSSKSPKFGPKKGIKCGKCHEYHATSDDVKKCYGIK